MSKCLEHTIRDIVSKKPLDEAAPIIPIITGIAGVAGRGIMGIIKKRAGAAVAGAVGGAVGGGGDSNTPTGEPPPVILYPAPAGAEYTIPEPQITTSNSTHSPRRNSSARTKPDKIKEDVDCKRKEKLAQYKLKILDEEGIYEMFGRVVKDSKQIKEKEKKETQVIIHPTLKNPPIK